jgi:hypothetical protein
MKKLQIKSQFKGRHLNIAKSGLISAITQLTVLIILTFVLLLGSGCTSIGPDRLVSSHEGYNDAVQLTVTREVLKNIVRTRYSDPLQFITVSAINAQFSVNAGANVGAIGIGTEGAAGQAGGNVGYSDSPTITYIPLSDAGFNKSIDSPVDLQEAVSYVFHWGQFQPHEVGLVIGAVNDAHDRSGPAGDSYRAQVDALVRLIDRGATLRHFREFYPRHAPIPMSQIDGRAYLDAAEKGFYFYEAGDGKLYRASKHLGIGIVVPLPHKDETEADLRMLGLTLGKRLYPIRAPGEAEPEPFGIQPDTIWLAPRSVESMIELAAMSVAIPMEHERIGVAPKGGPAVNSGFVLPMRVLYSTQQPTSVYRIQHRGYWFYIDDTDAAFKQLFSTIVQAYTSRIGSRTPTDKAPQIMLPIGGS